MSLVLNEKHPSSLNILVWNIQETEETLKKFLNEPEISIDGLLSGVKHFQRRKQKLVTKVLLGMLGISDVSIFYSEEGKPMLASSDGHISVSHSGEYVALIYHKHKIIGVDIELPDERVFRISGRFLNKTENLWVEIAKKEFISLIWGVKESVFKAIGGGGIDFKKNIIVSMPYENTGKSGKGLVKFIKNNNVQNFQYHFRYLEDYLLVYTIAEN